MKTYWKINLILILTPKNIFELKCLYLSKVFIFTVENQEMFCSFLFKLLFLSSLYVFSFLCHLASVSFEH